MHQVVLRAWCRVRRARYTKMLVRRACTAGNVNPELILLNVRQRLH